MAQETLLLISSNTAALQGGFEAFPNRTNNLGKVVIHDGREK